MPFVQVLSEMLLSDKELQGNSDVLCEIDAKFTFAQSKLEMCKIQSPKQNASKMPSI